MNPVPAQKLTDGKNNISPEYRASYFSILTSWWIQPFINRVAHDESPLSIEEIYTLPIEECASYQYEKFKLLYDKYYRSYEEMGSPEKICKKALVMASWDFFRFKFLISSLYRLIGDIIALLLPIVIRKFIIVSSTADPDDMLFSPPYSHLSGPLLIAYIFVSSQIFTMSHSIAMKNLRLDGEALANLFANHVFRHALRLGPKGIQDFPIARIVSYLSVDVPKLEEVFLELSFIFSSIFLIFSSYIMLGLRFGFVTATITILFLFGIILIGMKFTKLEINSKEALVRCIDIRAKWLTETFRNIKIVKLYSYESFLVQKLKSLRQNELVHLSRYYFCKLFQMGLSASAPILAPSLTFLVYTAIVSNAIVTSDLVFGSLLIFNILREPCLFLQLSTNFLAQVDLAVNRISYFLANGEELPRLSMFGFNNSSSFSIELQEASFLWHVPAPLEQNVVKRYKRKYKLMSTPNVSKVTYSPFSLKNISMKVAKGSMVLICGQIGSGKSSLLHAIIGELKLVSGAGNLPSKFFFSTQEPWISNASIKDAILFHEDYDLELFTNILEIVCFTEDLSQFPQGVDTIVGERGALLSGGQKQRIHIARTFYHAVKYLSRYPDKHVCLLLDDPFSALDKKTARTLFDNVRQSTLFAKMTKVMVSHKLELSSYCDKIILMEKGSIIQQGSFKVLCEQEESPFYMRLQAYRQKHAILSTNVQQKIDSLDSVLETNNVQIPGKQHFDNIVEEEERGRGPIPASVYISYINLCGGVVFVVALLLSLFLVNFLRIYSELWLAASLSPENFPLGGDKLLEFLKFFIVSVEGDDKNFQALLIMAIFGVFSLLQVASFLAFMYVTNLGCLHACRMFYLMITEKLLYASLTEFFERQPIGRLLSRLIKDLESFDIGIMNRFRMVAFKFYLVLSSFIYFLVYLFIVDFRMALVFTAVSASLFCLYAYIVNEYRPALMELNRLKLLVSSPLLSTVTEALSGLLVVRNLDKTDMIIVDFNNWLNKRYQISYQSKHVGNWAVKRFDYIGDFLNLTMYSGVYVMSHTFEQGIVNAGMIGFLYNQIFQLSNNMFWALMKYVDLEAECASFERLNNYLHVPQELRMRGLNVDSAEPSSADGEIKHLTAIIQFENFWLRYRRGPYILHNISLTIPNGCRVGIVGLTGSGKSSIISALYRFSENHKGDIKINGKSIYDMSLFDELRQLFTIIPQEPLIFSTMTVRENLNADSSSFASDDYELWKVLKLVHLDGIFQGAEKSYNMSGLDAIMPELSQGEKQVFCLARALLKKTPILIMDEPTSSMDSQSDSVYQQLLKDGLPHKPTVLTIAHRLDTLMNYDKILFLDRGKVVEFDSPSSLLTNSKSAFFQLYHAMDSKGKL